MKIESGEERLISERERMGVECNADSGEERLISERERG